MTRRHPTNTGTQNSNNDNQQISDHRLHFCRDALMHPDTDEDLSWLVGSV